MSYPSDPYGGSPGYPGQQPGFGGQPYGGQPEPDNYLVWAILCTVMCCLPFGVVSIIYSTKVSGLWAQGRYGEAQAASASARKWALIGAIAGAVVAVVSVVLYIILAVVLVSNTPSIPETTYSGY